MLKLSKRCKSLVALLLLCGCLVGFSSVSFAAGSINLFDGKTYYSNTDVPVAGLSRSVAVTSLRPEVLFLGTSGNLNYYNAYERDYFTFTLSNTTDTPYVFSPDLIVNFHALYSDMVFSDGITWNGGKATFIENQHADVWTVGLTSSGSPSSQIAFRVAPNYNSQFVLYPHQTVSLSFTLVRVYYLSSNNTRNYSNSIAFTLNEQSNIDSLYTGIPSGQYNSSFVPPVSSGSISQGESNIDSAIQSQTQQQQQQYDDFTNDGNAPTGGGISGSDFVGGSREEVNDKLGFFEIINYTIQGILGVFNADVILTDTSLTLPGFEIPIRSNDPVTGMATSTSYTVWRNTEYDLGQELNTNFGDLMTVVRFATSVVVLFGLINYIIKVYHRILGIPRG